MDHPQARPTRNVSVDGARIQVFLGLVAVWCYVLGSLESGMSVTSGVAAFALWGISILIAIAGIVAAARRAVRRECRWAMELASGSLFLCAIVLVALRVARWIQ